MAQSIPLEDVSLIRRCLETLSPYRGSVPVGEDDKRIMLGFLRELPDECWIYPAAIGDFADIIYYAERPIGDTGHATDHLEFVIGKTVLSLRRLLIEQLLLQLP